MRDGKEIQKDIEEIIRINDINIAENNKKELLKKNLEEKNRELMEEIEIDENTDIESLLEKELIEIEEMIAEIKKVQGVEEKDEDMDIWEE